eukprot:s140_g58.t1
MAPKKMTETTEPDGEQPVAKATPKPKAAPAPQMTDDQLLQLAVSTDFQEQVSGSSSDTMDDIIRRMQALAINYNKNMKIAKGYARDLTKEDRQIASKARAKAKIEEKKLKGAEDRATEIELSVEIVGEDGVKFRVKVLRGATAGTLRLIIGQRLGLSRAKSLKLDLYDANGIELTSSPRKTLAKLDVEDGDVISVRLVQPTHQFNQDDDNESVATTSISQETIDTMLARDLEEGSDDEMDGEPELEQ